jgi:guanosine-3',5'-bis(diphosphate) 3'-pyrophosphohydrolase
MDLLSKVITFAVNAHEGQTDKIGEPYILHPLRVMMDCNSMVEKLVAILHDTVEDTDATLDDIRALFVNNRTFADTVVDAVDAITKKKGQSYDDYLAVVKQNPIALSVKLADIRDNMSPVRQYRLPMEKQIALKAKYLKALAVLQ